MMRNHFEPSSRRDDDEPTASAAPGHLSFSERLSALSPPTAREVKAQGPVIVGKPEPAFNPANLSVAAARKILERCGFPTPIVKYALCPMGEEYYVPGGLSTVKTENRAHLAVVFASMLARFPELEHLDASPAFWSWYQMVVFPGRNHAQDFSAAAQQVVSRMAKPERDERGAIIYRLVPLESSAQETWDACTELFARGLAALNRPPLTPRERRMPTIVRGSADAQYCLAREIVFLNRPGAAHVTAHEQMHALMTGRGYRFEHEKICHLAEQLPFREVATREFTALFLELEKSNVENPTGTSYFLKLDGKAATLEATGIVRTDKRASLSLADIPTNTHRIKANPEELKQILSLVEAEVKKLEAAATSWGADDKSAADDEDKSDSEGADLSVLAKFNLKAAEIPRVTRSRHCED